MKKLRITSRRKIRSIAISYLRTIDSGEISEKGHPGFSSQVRVHNEQSRHEHDNSVRSLSSHSRCAGASLERSSACTPDNRQKTSG